MSALFKVFIGNVNFKTTEEQLRRLFEPHVELEDLVIARDARTGKPQGFGFALIKDHAKAREAIRRIGKVYIDGRLVYLKEAHGKKAKSKPSRPMRRRRGRPTPTVEVRNLRRRPASAGGYTRDTQPPRDGRDGAGGGNQPGGDAGGS